MSAALAKTEPRLKEDEILGLIDEAIWNYQHNQDETGRTNLIGAKQAIHMALEVSPTAERTALMKELRADISRTATTGFNASGFKKYVIQEIDLIMGLDAQERAGAKAE